MSQIAFRIKSYIQYLLKSSNLHGIHSPFIYQLTKDAIYDRTRYPEYKLIEKTRNDLFRDVKEIQITDFGAGSNINKDQKRKISDIARNSAKSNKYGRLLFRLCRHLKTKNAIELGTSLGISSLYIASANSEVKLHTIEGCPETAKIAQQNFSKVGAKNIKLHNNNFETALSEILPSIEKLDLVFIDGNHRKNPTLEYFEMILPYTNNDTVLIFDDIHWSIGMTEAWQEIISHPKVTASVDLFELGIVFFRKEQEKENFVVRF